ncbi:fumarylacetoacetate (FAA) hydrolase [Craurococcus roseus]|uniref:Fumarylacetoacetate (FAA) hydrolase n=1 Tax=Craurococcus roseus TaxID=77585 RepID=A0ABP3Q662_9PROT
MMGDLAAQAASDVLWRHWRAGTVLEGLPEAFRPETREEGYAIQALLEARSAKPLFGWKIAATSAAGQAHINVDGPLAGRLLAEMVAEDGGALPFGANRMRVAEAEFAFRMGHDLPPREAPYTADDVVAAVASLHPAIEVPDSRFADFTRAGAAQLIADDACARQFALGPATGADWRGMDLAAHPVRGSVNGKVAEGRGANALGDPRLALVWLANELSALGVALAAGQVVTTGTCVVPMPIAPGVEVAADLGILGKTTLRLTG